MKVFLAILLTFVVTVVGIIFVFRALDRAPDEVVEISDKAIERVSRGIVPEKEDEEEDLTDAQRISRAVDANISSTVTIHALDSGEGAPEANIGMLEKTFVAKGVAVDQNGTIATASAAVTEGGTYSVRIPGKKESFAVQTVYIDGPIAILKTGAQTGRAVTLQDDVPSVDTPVVALGGTLATQIAATAVTAIQKDAEVPVIETPIPTTLPLGTPLISVDKEVIGIVVVEGAAHFVAASVIEGALDRMR